MIKFGTDGGEQGGAGNMAGTLNHRLYVELCPTCPSLPPISPPPLTPPAPPLAPLWLASDAASGYDSLDRDCLRSDGSVAAAKTLGLVDVSATVTAQGGGRMKFAGAAASGDFVVFAPYSAEGVGVWHATDRTFSLFDISATINAASEPDAVTAKFSGAATAGNGLVVFSPFGAAGIGVFDPTAASFTYHDVSATVTDASLWRFGGASAAADGTVVLAPYNADGVGVFDATTGVFNYHDISATIDTNFKFFSAATASNGLVVFAPYTNSNGVGVFDPATATFSLYDISATLSGNSLFRGAAATGDGRVVFAPHAARGVGVFDAVDKSFSFAATSASSGYSFKGAAAARNGLVVFAPNDAHAVGYFDPQTQAFAQYPIAEDLQFDGAATASNGDLVFAPSTSDSVGWTSDFVLPEPFEGTRA